MCQACVVVQTRCKISHVTYIPVVEKGLHEKRQKYITNSINIHFLIGLSYTLQGGTAK